MPNQQFRLLEYLLLLFYAFTAYLSASNASIWYTIWKSDKSRMALALLVDASLLTTISVAFGAGAVDRILISADLVWGNFAATEIGRMLFWSVMLSIAVVNFGIAHGWFRNPKGKRRTD